MTGARILRVPSCPSSLWSPIGFSGTGKHFLPSAPLETIMGLGRAPYWSDLALNCSGLRAPLLLPAVTLQNCFPMTPLGNLSHVVSLCLILTYSLT